MKIALIGRFGEGDIIPWPERVARELFAELREINLEVVFIEYFFKGYSSTSLVKRIFGHTSLNHDNSIKRLGIFPLLLSLITKQYDVIHLVNLQRFFLFIFLAKPFIKSRFVATLHSLLKLELQFANLFISRNFIDLYVEKLIIKKSDLLIFPSCILLNQFREYFKISENKWKIIPNGAGKIFGKLDTFFPPVKDSLNCVFYNGFTDSIMRGVNDLFDLLKESKNKIKLYIIGNPVPDIHSMGNLEVIYSKLKNQKELIEFLRDKHVLIKADAFDSFSITTAECMTLGLIPIITNKTGIKDFIEHGVNGFIYDKSAPFDFGLVKILSDISNGKYDLNLISCNAKKIYGELNWINISSQYIKAYTTLS